MKSYTLLDAYNLNHDHKIDINPYSFNAIQSLGSTYFYCGPR